MAALRDVLRELGRRRVRSLLTAGGIAIGVAALVLLGALTEKLDRLVSGGRDFASGQITVSGAGAGGATGGMIRGALLSAHELAILPTIDGVVAVAPIVVFPVATDAPQSLPFTMPPLVFGTDLAVLWAHHSVPPPRLARGRLMPGADADEVVVGSEVARTHAVDLGSRMRIRGRDFTVVGILEVTLTGPDSFVFMSFPLAQRLLVDSEPVLRRAALVPGSGVLPVATAAAVFWEAGRDPEGVARDIRARLPDVTIITPTMARAQIDGALAFLRALVLGGGIIALVVAVLAVANTMVTAVVERRREIGLRRVVGATRRQVVRLLMLEATVLGFAGGALGTLVGTVAVIGLNELTERLGASAFLVTPRLLVLALLLPAVLAALAGAWPARRAVRLTPTEALRYV